MPSVDVVKGLIEVFKDKGISVQSDRVSTNQYPCAPNKCPWSRTDYLWKMDETVNWPFRSWRAAEIYARIVFEYNGCDINDAHLEGSSRSYSRWYNDSAKFEIIARGGASRQQAKNTGCAACCSNASIIRFDVSLVVKWDIARIDERVWAVEISADDHVTILEA